MSTIKKYADKESIESRKKRICQLRPDWSNTRSLEQETAYFIRRLIRIDPDITDDDELFKEVVNILP